MMQYVEVGVFDVIAMVVIVILIVGTAVLCFLSFHDEAIAQYGDLEAPMMSQETPRPPQAFLYVGEMLANVDCTDGSIDSAGSVVARVAIVGQQFIVQVKFGKPYENQPHAVIVTPTGFFSSSQPMAAGNLTKWGFDVYGHTDHLMGMAMPIFNYAVL